MSTIYKSKSDGVLYITMKVKDEGTDKHGWIPLSNATHSGGVVREVSAHGDIVSQFDRDAEWEKVCELEELGDALKQVLDSK